jgi:hypothetical protein
MSDFLRSPLSRSRPQPDQAGTLEMLATLFLVAFVVAILYVGREIFIPIAIAILASFVLSPPIHLLRRGGFWSCSLRLDRRPCCVGHRIFGQCRFDAAGF